MLLLIYLHLNLEYIARGCTVQAKYACPWNAWCVYITMLSPSSSKSECQLWHCINGLCPFWLRLTRKNVNCEDHNNVTFNGYYECVHDNITGLHTLHCNIMDSRKSTYTHWQRKMGLADMFLKIIWILEIEFMILCPYCQRMIQFQLASHFQISFTNFQYSI